MKTEEKLLPHPIKVIQVYRHINIFGKENKSSEERKIRNTWRPIESHNGHFSKGRLYLPAGIIENKDLSNIDLILIVDDNPSSITIEKKSEDIFFLNLSHPKKWGIFELQLHDLIELHLIYNHFDIGEPAREDFKLCELKLQQPQEIQINGKLDFSLSSRRARSYKEQFYIFDYLGEVDKIILSNSANHSIIKEIPDNRKVINLCKPLW